MGLLERFGAVVGWPFRKETRHEIDAADRWFVELDEQPVAMISNPAGDEMFWLTWDITPLDGTPIPRDLWDYANDTRRSFRHAVTGERNLHTIPAGAAVLENGRVLLRGPFRVVTKTAWTSFY